MDTISTMLSQNPHLCAKPGYGTFWPKYPVMAVGTAMMAAQAASFLVISLSWASRSQTRWPMGR